MTTDEVAAIIAYVDARIEEELASHEDGADGYRGSAHHERQMRESAAAHLRAVAKKALDTVK